MASTITNFLQALCIAPTATATPAATTHKGYGSAKGGSVNGSELLEIPLHEVAMHDSYDDCWIIIYDRVYDVTRFLHSHPGGADVIMDHAGRDATLAFHGTGHSKDAIEQMRDYVIGELPFKERIFRTPNNKILTIGIPE